MRPKGKLIALLVMFVAIGLVAGTGAFTTVSAERTAQVNVAGDENALLQLQPNGSTYGVDGNEYIDTTGNDIVIDFDGTDTGFGNSNNAKGLNAKASTRFNSLLDITNQGNQQVTLSFSVSVATNNAKYNGASVTDSNVADSLIIEYTDSGADATQNSVDLSSGETTTVNVMVDMTDGNGVYIDEGDFSYTITIDASA